MTLRKLGLLWITLAENRSCWIGHLLVKTTNIEFTKVLDVSATYVTSETGGQWEDV
jgi:hypothetical protein